MKPSRHFYSSTRDKENQALPRKIYLESNEGQNIAMLLLLWHIFLYSSEPDGNSLNMKEKKCCCFVYSSVYWLYLCNNNCYIHKTITSGKCFILDDTLPHRQNIKHALRFVVDVQGWFQCFKQAILWRPCSYKVSFRTSVSVSVNM